MIGPGAEAAAPGTKAADPGAGSTGPRGAVYVGSGERAGSEGLLYAASGGRVTAAGSGAGSRAGAGALGTERAWAWPHTGQKA